MRSPRWSKLARDLRAEWGRLAAMGAAVAVSLAAVGTMLGAYAILTREIRVNYLGTRPAAATLELEGGVPPALVDRVRARPEVEEAEGREVLRARFRHGDDWRPMILFVVPDFEGMRLNTFRSERGAWPPPPGAMLVERSALGVLGVGPGARVEVEVPGSAARPLAIAGVVHDPGLAPASQERQAYGYVTPATLEAMGVAPTLHELRIALRGHPRDPAEIERAAAGLAAWLGAEGHPVHQLRIPPPDQHPHELQLRTLVTLLLAFAVLALVLSAILVATSLSAMLARQVREIGVMKTVGATGSQIAGLYRALVLLLGAASAAIALPAGVAGARQLSRETSAMLNFDLTSAALPGWYYLVVIAAGVLVPLAVAAVPIRRASRITVREAIDQYGASGDVLRRWASSLPYGLRNALRRPGRTALTLGLLAAGGGIFLAALDVSRAWERNVAKVEETRSYDAELRLAEPRPAALSSELARLPGVARVEAWGYAPAAFAEPGRIDVVQTYPDRSHGSLAVLAPPDDDAMVRFPLLRGRWIRPDDSDAVVLNQTALARRPGLQLGDRVLLSFDGAQTAWRLAGVVEEIGSPGAAYVSASAFARATGGAGGVQMFRVAVRGAPAERAAAIRPLAGALAARGAPVERVIPVSELRLAIGDHVAMLVRALMVMALVIGLVGVLALGSTSSVAVLERTRELGVLSALGATPAMIQRRVVGEAVLVAGVSWVLAIGLGLALTAGLDRLVGMLGFLAPLPFTVAPGPKVLWLALILVVAAAASLLPARAAARVTVREALAHP